MANLRLKVEKLRKQVEILVRNEVDSIQTYPEDCICFPQDTTAPRLGAAPLTFGSQKHLELALSIRCLCTVSDSIRPRMLDFLGGGMAGTEEVGFTMGASASTTSKGITGDI
jgi:hypothetical protein